MTSKIQLYQGDCLEVMKNIPDKSVDLVFTSPPYNLGVSSGGGFPKGTSKGKWSGGDLSNGYATYNDALPYHEYVEWQKAVLLECWRTLSDNGAIYYNHKPRVQNGILQTPLELNPGLPLRQIVIWERNGGINFSPSFYLPTHEWILIFAKPNFRLRDKKASGAKDIWKTFSISKYGDEEAFRLAVQFRLEGIKRMNEEFNLDYTERHVGNEFKDVLSPSNI